jgi:hypothetical protein
MSKEEKYDLFINLKFLKEQDKAILDFLSKKKVFKKSIAPLVKTSSQKEYDNVVSQYFTN